jgi:hypothetical protein
MQLSSKPTLSVLAACALIYTIYLPIALWLQHSYVPPPYAPLAPRIQQWPLQKIHPLEGFAFVSALDRFVSLEDDKAEQHSPVVLYEDGKPLGPAHSLHGDIEHIGHGRYSHWKGAGIIFSTSDNSDPTKNGRRYWVVCETESPLVNAPGCRP